MPGTPPFPRLPREPEPWQVEGQDAVAEGLDGRLVQAVLKAERLEVEPHAAHEVVTAIF